MPRRGRRWHEGDGTGASPLFGIRRFLEPCLLLLLHRGASHGYELAEGLECFGFPRGQVDSSLIYRTLRQLEFDGMLTSKWDTSAAAGPPRRVYHLTPLGDQYLAAWVRDLRATDRALHRFLDVYNVHMKEGEGEYH